MSPVTTETPTQFAARYLWFARVFDYPDRAFWEAAVSGEPVPAFAALDQGRREADYMAAFELGGESPPVPLYEGLCQPREGREGVLEDVLRFYDYFDVRLREENRDYPDHLVTELEFMALLALREASALAAGRDPGAFRRAARDFLARHLGVWVPALRERLEETGSAYASLARELLVVIRSHEALLQQENGGDER
jgi:DMSO reductase family type II enzyme chaperone